MYRFPFQYQFVPAEDMAEALEADTNITMAIMEPSRVWDGDAKIEERERKPKGKLVESNLKKVLDL